MHQNTEKSTIGEKGNVDSAESFDQRTRSDCLLETARKTLHWSLEGKFPPKIDLASLSWCQTNLRKFKLWNLSGQFVRKNSKIWTISSFQTETISAAALPLLCLPVIVRSSQRVDSSEARHVDVVLDDHHVSHFVVLVEASSCVGQDHRLHAHQLEDTHGQRDLQNTRWCQTLAQGCDMIDSNITLKT